MSAALLAGAAVTCGDATGPGNSGSLPPLSSLDVLADSLSFAVGDSVVLGVTAATTGGGYADRTSAEWVSRDPSAVQVSAPGVIRARAFGRVWVVARNGSLADSVLAEARARLPLSLASHAVTMTAIGDSLTIGRSVGSGMVAARIAWGSRDTTIATVSQSGIVVARGNGSTWVVALEDGGASDSSIVAVHQALARVDVMPSNISRPLMRTQQFTATPRDSSPR